MRIGLTGQIASGKSLVLSFFSELGAQAISSDEVVHGILKEEDVLKKAACLLNIGIGEEVTRGKIADVIFSDRGARERYLAYLYPLVFERMRLLEQKDKFPVAVWEVPLLFEADWEGNFEKIVYVFSDKGERLRRWKARGFSEDDFLRREKLFMGEREKMRRSDFVVENNGTVLSLKHNVGKIWDLLLKEVRNAG